ncbi:UPF0261-domain-containing protein [Coniophora puteana RWD-64-598 SS2]|uniref:UPF0261-domain-containing protein n=1 Tax=Coniophora puteana (strain RWD-64-598) TaxID=741705 RepID=A0A5M3N1P3_CONPW|nr:UPF0261-domain-containing protein [Coniophora puteana RWD-64-598 SS2]EIW84825.1 UPF0261-domain-containing protein [Coniophora puteana RWD-64-598 SS2]
MSTRGAAMTAMSDALRVTLQKLYEEGKVAGAIGAGGSGNTSVCAAAFRNALPLGAPKMLVSTMAAGDTRAYVGGADVTMMYSVADIAGMNPILRTVLTNAASAIAGMVEASWQAARVEKRGAQDGRPAIAVTMFGLTTPCVEMMTPALEELGYSVVVFHANGAGGQSMERLIAEGHFAGVIDLTTTELADELVGGVLSAGPDRLTAAARAGIPQVISIGALDMVNFGPAATVPEIFQGADKGRTFVHHNPTITLMRTTAEECRTLGETIVKKLRQASPEKTRVILPLRGLSGIDKEGGPFYDAEADQALLNAIREGGLECRVEEIDAHINDRAFADAVVKQFQDLLRTQ